MDSEEKRLPWIKVVTYPNGYGLEYEGMKHSQGFMYYTPEKLLEGFMLHIGLGMTEQLDADTMQDFIAAAVRWKDNESCIKEIKALNGRLNALRLRRNGLATRLIAERNRVLALVDGVKRMAGRYREMKELYSQLYGIIKNSVSLKPYTLSDLGIKSPDVEDMDDMDETE